MCVRAATTNATMQCHPFRRKCNDISDKCKYHRVHLLCLFIFCFLFCCTRNVHMLCQQNTKKFYAQVNLWSVLLQVKFLNTGKTILATQTSQPWWLQPTLLLCCVTHCFGCGRESTVRVRFHLHSALNRRRQRRRAAMAIGAPSGKQPCWFFYAQSHCFVNANAK